MYSLAYLTVFWRFEQPVEDSKITHSGQKPQERTAAAFTKQRRQHQLLLMLSKPTQVT